ncbi:MAG: cupredoxin domain-containing protein [Nanoarchaeota archaeon]
MNKRITVVLIAIVVIAVVGFLVFNKPSNSSSSSDLPGTNTNGGSSNAATDSNTVTAGNSAQNKVITLDAQRFEYTPSTITVKKGDRVKIVMNNIDTTHGIAIPDYNVTGVDGVEFIADKAGTFTFHCPTFCGGGHREMTGTLVVQE